MVFAAQEEDSIRPGVGIELVGLQEGRQQFFRKGALSYQVALDRRPLAGVG